MLKGHRVTWAEKNLSDPRENNMKTAEAEKHIVRVTKRCVLVSFCDNKGLKSDSSNAMPEL